MLFHVKLEFDLDTDTRQTTNVTPQVITRAAQHVCRYPPCGKAIGLEQIYCNETCFRSHGQRRRNPKVHVVLPPPQETVTPSRAEAAHIASVTIPSTTQIPDYRFFTFPQGGLS